MAHRDLKPQNLLVGDHGILKIADFGLAASFNPDPALRYSTRSLRRTMCGSPLYMAPELLTLRSGSAYNAMASDVWSCGAVLFAMAVGHAPFPAISLPELVQMASNAGSTLKFPDGCTRDFRSLVRGLLTIDPHRRLTLLRVREHAWLQPGMEDTLVRHAHGGGHGLIVVWAVI